MMEQTQQDISLRVPGEMAYALVIRTALGGVAILKDLSVDQMDDLRTAADEACDCLLHQGREVAQLTLTVTDGGERLTVSIEADFTRTNGVDEAECREETEISSWMRILLRIFRSHIRQQYLRELMTESIIISSL